jgi:hypothetical protein
VQRSLHREAQSPESRYGRLYGARGSEETVAARATMPQQGAGLPLPILVGVTFIIKFIHLVFNEGWQELPNSTLSKT